MTECIRPPLTPLITDAGNINSTSNNKSSPKKSAENLTAVFQSALDKSKAENASQKKIEEAKEVDHKQKSNKENQDRTVYFGVYTTDSSGDIIPNGFGTLYLNNEKIYEGFWKDKKRNGQGAAFHKGRPIYTGDFVNNCYHGTGRLFGENGTEYEGQWKNGLRHGEGTHYKNGLMTYLGNFADGQAHGFGKAFDNEELYYEGNFIQGRITGKGSYLNNGTVYRGEFLNGKCHGNVEITKRNGSKVSGVFENGDCLQANGYLNGVSKIYCGDVFVNNDRIIAHGHGTLMGPKNCVIYTGNWNNNKADGEGTKYRNGYELSGNWKDGKLHGSATLFLPSHSDGNLPPAHGRSRVGKLITGTWNGGTRDGNFAYHDSWGNHCDMIYVNGNLVSGAGSLSYGRYICDSQIFSGDRCLDGLTGLTYTGSWNKGRMDGHGRLVSVYDQFLIEGRFAQGMIKAGTIYFDRMESFKGKAASTNFLYSRELAGYRGEWSNNKFHGYGALAYPGQAYLEGTFKEGVFQSGRGNFVKADTTIYDGEMVLTKRGLKAEGQGKIRDSLNEIKFWGNWKKGLKHGLGIRYLDDGCFVRATYNRGKFISGNGLVKLAGNRSYEGGVTPVTTDSYTLHGKGTLKINGKTAITGNWVNGKKNGEAIEYLTENGEEWVKVLYKDDKFVSGYGKYKSGNEDYEGEVIPCNNGKFTAHGKGFFTKEGKITESGTFKNGLRHGEIKFFTGNDSITCHYNEDQFVSGTGKMCYENDDFYEGEITKADDGYFIYNGQGTFTFSDGMKLTGTFAKEFPLKQVVLTSVVDGFVYHGDIVYHDGDYKPHGKGTKTHNDGRIESGFWVNGELLSIVEDDKKNNDNKSNG